MNDSITNNDDTSGINDILFIIAKAILPSFSRIFKEWVDHNNHLNDGVYDTDSNIVGTRGSGSVRNYGNGKLKEAIFQIIF